MSQDVSSASLCIKGERAATGLCFTKKLQASLREKISRPFSMSLNAKETTSIPLIGEGIFAMS